MRLTYVQAAITAARAHGECLMHWSTREQKRVFLAALDAVPDTISATSEWMPDAVYQRVYAAALDAVVQVLRKRERKRYA